MPQPRRYKPTLDMGYELLTTTEVGARLHVGYQTVQRLVYRGIIPARKDYPIVLIAWGDIAPEVIRYYESMYAARQRGLATIAAMKGDADALAQTT